MKIRNIYLQNMKINAKLENKSANNEILSAKYEKIKV
jgi:hypothetical protein